MHKTIENGITVLKADDGMKLTDGSNFGSVVYLGVNDSENNWREITQTEAERMMEETEKSEDEATEADYIAQLQRLGVAL